MSFNGPIPNKEQEAYALRKVIIILMIAFLEDYNELIAGDKIEYMVCLVKKKFTQSP